MPQKVRDYLWESFTAYINGQYFEWEVTAEPSDGDDGEDLVNKWLIKHGALEGETVFVQVGQP